MERKPLCNCASEVLTFSHSSVLNCGALLLHDPSFNLDPSPADGDLLYNTTLNVFSRGSAIPWPFFTKGLQLFVCVNTFQASVLFTTSRQLYLVPFDSSARQSSGPPQPLQASLSLWKVLHSASWNSSFYIWNKENERKALFQKNKMFFFSRFHKRQMWNNLHRISQYINPNWLMMTYLQATALRLDWKTAELAF